MRANLRFLVVILSITFSLTCSGTSSSKSGEENTNPGATGNVEIQHSYHFTNNSFATVPAFIFLYQNDGNPIPIQTAQSNSLRRQKIQLKAVGGTLNSGVKSAYTWSVTGLPDWMELSQDSSSFYIQIKSSQANTTPCSVGSPCEPSAATGQVRDITITDGGLGYVPPATVTISGGDGLGFEINNGNSLTAGHMNGSGTLTSVPVSNRGVGYTTLPSVAIAGGSPPATLSLNLQQPLDLTITATADTGKSATVNTKLVILFNDKTPDGSGPLYPKVLNAYSSTNGNALSSNEDDRFPNDVDSTTPPADPDNDGCTLGAGDYQPIMPKQTIIAKGGISGKDCYAFYVPADGIQVSFTIATGSSLNGIINKCSTPQPDSCDYQGGTSNTTYTTALTNWQNNVQNNTSDGCMSSNGQLLDFSEFLSPITNIKICSNGTNGPVGIPGGRNASPQLTITNGVITGISMSQRGEVYWFAGNSAPTVKVTGISGTGTGFAGTPTRSFSDDFAIANGGTGYSVNDTLTITGGGGTAATLTVTAIGTGGVITNFAFATNGAYTSLPASPANVTGGTGTGATFSFSSTGIGGITIGNGGSGYGYPYNVINQTVSTGLYACPFYTTGSCQSRAIAMSLNSSQSPTWQRVEAGNSSNPRTWRWSYRFTSQNGMPRFASLAANAKCDLTKTGPWGSPAAFEADTNCYEDPRDATTNYKAWRTGPGWYFFVVDSTQTWPQSNNAEQPYTITMDYNTN